MKNNLNRNSAYATNWNNMLMLKQKNDTNKNKRKYLNINIWKLKLLKTTKAQNKMTYLIKK